MAIPATLLADCQIIAKAFERGCNFSATEESVFAVMAPSICTMRNLAQSTASLIKENPIIELDSAKSLVERWTQGGLSGSDCLPCDLRINFKEQLTFEATWKKLYQHYYAYFTNAITQILAMTNLLTGKGKTTDICPLIKFFKEFMCVPDLQRMIAALTALIMQLGIELSSLFDLVLQLVGPLMMPFLNEIINQINQFFLTAIKPLECIIGVITSHLSKLDYGAIFSNPTNAQIKGTIETGTITLTKSKVDLNPIATNQNQKDHLAVLKAEEKLIKIKQNSKNINISNSSDVILQRQQEQQSQQEYQDSLRNKDLTAIGKTNEELHKILETTRSALFNLIKYLKMVIDKFNAFQNILVGDFIKMLNTLTGGGTGLLIQLNDKLAIVQLITLIKAIMNVYKNGLQCDTDGDKNNIIPVLPIRSNMVVYEDKEGYIHIDENSSEIDAAIDGAIKGIGRNPDNFDVVGNGDVAYQKLTSLIKLTGNELLDSDISRVIESLARPSRVTFKCPLETTVADAEKVNQWISELNAL